MFRIVRNHASQSDTQAISPMLEVLEPRLLLSGVTMADAAGTLEVTQAPEMVVAAVEPTFDPGIPGDADLDGDVDWQDFNIMKENFCTGTTWAQGDFNDDGKVNLQDFCLLKAYWGSVLGTKAKAANENVVGDASATWFTQMGDTAVAFQFGTEAAVSINLTDATAYSMRDVAMMINYASQSASGYDMASIVYCSEANVYILKLEALNVGAGVAMTVTAGAGTDPTLLDSADDFVWVDGIDVRLPPF